MSSLRNSIQRRSHRERAQPLERARLGLLEKKKDYQKRAADYNKKKAVLRSLRAKAAERNEDEFYYGMLSRNGPGSSITRGSKRFDGTVENSRGNEAMSVEVVRLLKTQDLGYLRTVRNVAAKEVRELEERWAIAGGGELEEEESEEEDVDFGLGMGGKQKQGTKKAPKKIVFCDGEEERKKAKQEAEAKEDDAQWEDEEDDENSPKAKEAERKAQNLDRLEKKLRNARKKLKALSDAEFQLEVQQAKMAKTATSGGYTKNGHKIKVRERKR
ncbi:small-subunit processome [Podospora aff. communis PSN243]|uniref:U3 small nucleolar RNA-associated protein 11 n=1 Tax=Podospora aff. communis PSN243 TaxID=3040156 RepID=A0AAV9H6Y9_9PEZI|nr:small-subunit processome [Podospora aff. communis PSN243]